MSVGEQGSQPTLGSDSLDALRRRVLNVVGHELRTPITTLRGLADALQGADEDEIRRELGPALARTARRVEQLLDDLLAASEVTTALPVGPARPAEIVPAVRLAWNQLGHAGDPVIEGDLLLRVLAPAGSLPRILAQLLDNAAKYGVGPVTVRVERVVARVRITVAAAGPPASDIDLALAFEPFYRGEAAVTAAPGLGVGLTVARSLAEQAGGGVRLHALPGGGVAAIVELAGA